VQCEGVSERLQKQRGKPTRINKEKEETMSDKHNDLKLDALYTKIARIERKIDDVESMLRVTVNILQQLNTSNQKEANQLE
jgi:hypothetical protein